MNYKDRLTMLKLPPLMYWLELLEIMFFVKYIQQPADNFDHNPVHQVCHQECFK